MSSKRRDLCPNTQEELLAESSGAGAPRTKRDPCPYCVFLIGAHNKEPAAAAPAAVAASSSAASPALSQSASVRPSESRSAVAARSQADAAEDDQDECCICLEPLWSADGRGTKGGQAGLSCRHPVHSECLGQHTRREVEAAQASGVAANGIGAFGPRGSCPICRQPISAWVEIPWRWMSEAYWTRQIERVLVELGPHQRDAGERAVGREWQQVFQRLVNERCARLSAAELSEATGVMMEARKARGRVLVYTHGVDAQGDPTLTIEMSDGLWDLDEQAQRLWLHAWGPGAVQRVQTARRGGRRPH